MSSRPMLNPRNLIWPILIAPALIVFTLDQVTKAWVLATLPLGESVNPIPFIADYFRITHSTNSGAAFSLFQGGNAILTLLSILMMVAIPIYYARNALTIPLLGRFGLGLVWGGVLSNLLDRLRYGIVIDFFLLQIPRVIANVSNFADHAIVLGMILLVVASWRRPTPTVTDV